MYNMSGGSKCRGKNVNEAGTETCRGGWECYSFIDRGQGKHAKVRCGKHDGSEEPAIWTSGRRTFWAEGTQIHMPSHANVSTVSKEQQENYV